MQPVGGNQLRICELSTEHNGRPVREVLPSYRGVWATSRITYARPLTKKTEQPAIEAMPRKLHFSGHQIDVLETLDLWHGPGYRYIKARSTEGGLYIVRFDERQGEWELTMFKSTGAQERRDRQ